VRLQLTNGSSISLAHATTRLGCLLSLSDRLLPLFMRTCSHALPTSSLMLRLAVAIPGAQLSRAITLKHALNTPAVVAFMLAYIGIGVRVRRTFIRRRLTDTTERAMSFATRWQSRCGFRLERLTIAWSCLDIRLPDEHFGLLAREGSMRCNT